MPPVASSHSYDFRADFACPPPTVEAVAYAYDAYAEPVDPAPEGGRVLRAFSGRDADEIAPRGTSPTYNELRAAGQADAHLSSETQPSETCPATSGLSWSLP